MKDKPVLCPRRLRRVPRQFSWIDQRLVRVTNRCRVTLDTNRYSGPHIYASQRLTLHAFADRLCLYHQNQLIATHTRSYERHRDFENPDHVRELLDLDLLRLPFIKEHCRVQATRAATQSVTHLDYLARLVAGEAVPAFRPGRRPPRQRRPLPRGQNP